MVTKMLKQGANGYINFNPPVQYFTLFYDNNLGIINSKNFCWNIAGRIVHLLEDSSVPAHVHDDIHPNDEPPCTDNPDYYEWTYLSAHHTDKTWENAISAESYPLNGGPINLYGKSNPIRYLLYLTNQVADRFPSNDRSSDRNFTENSDNYGELLTPFYNLMDNQEISYDSFGGANPPENLMPTILRYSFVFNFRVVAGFLNFVYDQFELVSTAPPIVSTITQSPTPITPGNNSTFTCNLDPSGGSATSYAWSMVNETDFNITPVSSNGNQYTLHWTPSVQSKQDKAPSKNLKITCTAIGYGNSTKTINAYFYSNPIGGCPWLVVTDQDTSYNFDNNLLNKSQLPQNQGSFITDKYILKTKPGIFDNKIKLSIVETSTDSTIINSVKLYAITHPVGTKLGILSDNSIVMYDSISVIENTNASLYDPYNNYTNITNNILFHNSDKINNNTMGDSLYHIYAEYLTKAISNPGIITYMERGVGNPINPIAKDNYSGSMLINTLTGILQIPFMRRENPDDVIFPVNPESRTGSVDSIHIAWDKSFKIRYAAVASLLYSGFTVTELPLVTAFHTSDGDVLQNLLYIDSVYTYVSPNAYLNLEFSPSPAQGSSTSIKEYIIEINGQVIFLGNNRMKTTKVLKPDHNTIPDQYSLSQNYPNPFNPVTKINYSIPKQGFVTLKIYDLLGREIKSLVSETKLPGNFSVDFNGSNLASGVYFYRLESNGFSDIKRMMLIK
jgi:hypothetical protein